MYDNFLYILAKTNASNTLKIISGGVNTQYDQKIVRLIRRSNAFPEAACVICANVRAGGEHTSITLTTTKTGLNGLVRNIRKKKKVKALLLEYRMPTILRRQRQPRDQN